MNINLIKIFKKTIAVGLAAAMIITVSMPVTADFAQAEQGRRDYYSCTEKVWKPTEYTRVIQYALAIESLIPRQKEA